MQAGVENAHMLASLAVGDWIDIACLGVLLLHAIVGGLLRFSSLLASLTGLLLALHGGFWLFPTLDYHLRRLPPAARHPSLCTLFIYLAAFISVLLLFFLIRMLLRRIFRLLLDQPFDRVFGMLTGLLLGVTLVLFIFTAASLLPENHTIRQAVCVKSRTGGLVSPPLRALLAKHPNAIIRFTPDSWRLPWRKQENAPERCKPPAGKPRARPDRR